MSLHVIVNLAVMQLIPARLIRAFGGYLLLKEENVMEDQSGTKMGSREVRDGIAQITLTSNGSEE
jgi:hypothetical protein